MAKRNTSCNEYDLSESDLLCGKCNKLVDEPKLLDCLHYFCKDCLEVKVSLSCPSEKIKCPTCHEESHVPENDINRIPTATFIERMKDTYTIITKAKKQCIECNMCTENPRNATHFCNHCEFICEFCTEVHQKCKGFEHHKVTDIDTVKDDIKNHTLVREPPQCKDHDEQVKYFCPTCFQLVCSSCLTIGDHTGHNPKSVNKLKSICYKTLQDSLTLLSDEQRKRLEDGRTGIEVVQSEVNERVQMIEKQFDSKLKRLVESCQEKLKAELAKFAKVRLDEQLQGIKKCESTIDHAIWVVDSCLKSNSGIDIASCYEVMSRRLQKLIQESDRLNTKPVVTANINVDFEHIKVLEESIKEQTWVKEPPIDIVVQGNGIHTASVGETATLEIEINEQSCSTPLDIQVTLECLQKSPFESNTTPKLTVDIKRLSKGKYKASYIPEIRGKHRLTVAVNTEEIPSSPYNIFVHMPPKMISDKTGCIDSFSHGQPYQAAFTAGGELLVVDTSSSGSVLKSTDTRRWEEFRKELPETNELGILQGIATGNDGSVYIIYTGSFIVKYNDVGEEVKRTGVKGEKEGELIKPGRLKFNQNTSELYVCDRSNKRVQIFDRDLNFVRVFAKGRLFTDVTFDEDNHVYLSNKSSDCVYKFTANGKEVCKIGDTILKCPRGILYSRGFLYVVDRNHDRITVFNSTNDVENTFTCQGLHDPGSIMVNDNAYLYVCSERNGCIFVF